MNHDSNPGMGAPPAGSNGVSYELYDNIGSRGLVAVGEQLTNDGLGITRRSGTSTPSPTSRASSFSTPKKR